MDATRLAFDWLLPTGFFERDALAVAPELIGCCLTVRGTGGMIVETEAYRGDDPASHSFKGPTERNKAMFGPPGTAYVYRSYGIHWCLNVVCRKGEAVLLRALQPLAGIDKMEARRGLTDERRLCQGPGNLCQALGVDGRDEGKPFDGSELALFSDDQRPEGLRNPMVLVGTRIGLSRAMDAPWRFGLAASPYLSRRFT